MSLSDSFVNRVILVVGLLIAFDPLSARSVPVNGTESATDTKPILNRYFPWSDRCYKLHIRSEDWARARRACIGEGAHLVVVNDTEEAGMLKKHFHEKEDAVGARCVDAVFVGIHDQFAERDWTTIFDDPISTVFNEWTDKWGVQPDNFGGHQNCGTLYRDGKLNDVPCGMKLPFVCEKAAINGTCS